MIKVDVVVAIKKYLFLLLPLLLSGCYQQDKKFLIAEINDTEVKQVRSRHTFYHWALCANFTIMERETGDWHPIEKDAESYQCGTSWDDVIDGIRSQLDTKQSEMDAERRSKNEETRLNAIKNDYKGKSILGKFSKDKRS